MYKKNLKKYKQFVFNMSLMENFSMSVESNTEVDEVIKKTYNQIYFNQILMENIVNDPVNESFEEVVTNIFTDRWDKDPHHFYDSISSLKRKEFLIPYTVAELSKFDLYKVQGYNIGFAIKPDGDIISVHNNDNIKGIGEYLMKKSIQYGGNKLDHFDGFLTKFYKKFNFNFKNNNIWSDEYTPDNWKYIPLNIDDPDNSIYAVELKVPEYEYKDAKIRYRKGTPDIVYRSLL